MGTDKRARQKANRQARLAQAEAETTKETRERSVKRIGTIVAIVAAIVAVFVVINVLRGGDDEPAGIDFSETPSTGGETTAPADAEPVDVPLLADVPAEFVAFSGAGTLASVEPLVRNAVYDAAPDLTIDPSRSYAAIITTDAGVIRVQLFADEAPLTVNNFVNLARDGFYDGLSFHRVIEDFMAQGGDPTGTGSGGPGYSFADEFQSGRRFDKRGLLAMANSGPDTNGSQFFITFVDTPHLDGLHTIFGEVVRENGVLDEIVRTGEGDPTTIESIVIVEG